MQNLVNDAIRDLIADVRFSSRALNAPTWSSPWTKSEELVYMRECRKKALALFKARHHCKIGQFGLPVEG